ncbi:putative cytochrome P450 [Sclerotinia borealis F-4128]|uniref:Putative cytochrome P450 n=1 Tax=Sclerotinia borealis (strain F-4128) TaxID=1432307 RepID=W9C564_SCLBF|nr:putative cytochrome P450 [Sclerotinia borealis F-4128]
MLSEVLQQWLHKISNGLEPYRESNVVNVSLFLFGAYVAWSVWTFTILPKLQPDRPRVLPYWIPCHAISFFNDADGMFSYGRNYFKNTREPFAIIAAGETLYIITCVSAVSEVYRNIEQLTFDDYITDMMISFGASSKAIKTMWNPPSATLKRPEGAGPGKQALAHVAETLIRQQLQPGKNLDRLQDIFLNSVHRSMTWEHMASKAVLSSQQNMRTVSLLEWTREALLEGATEAFFGPTLLEIEPKLFESFFTFDDLSWKLTYRIPSPWSNDMKAAKATAQNALTRYFQMPKKQRPGACWLVETLETEMRAVDIEPVDIAAYLMMIYWVINANAWKVSFWMLAYLLHNPHLLTTIRDEISPILTAIQSPNELASSFNSTQTPRFLALYHEVLRLVTSSVSVRNIATPAYVGGKQLQPGGRVIIPYRQLLLNDEVFGGDAEAFNPERFLRDGSLSNNPSYRPYGGGTTYCPGRFLAKAEVLTCVAIATCKYDMEISHGSRIFPRLEVKKPCLGIMGPVEGDDVVVNIRRMAQ